MILFVLPAQEAPVEVVTQRVHRTTNSTPARGARGYRRNVPDDAFADPRLVALYDPSEGERPDLDLYERIIGELGVGSVLDLGCGTGTLACRLAVAGVTVIGVDPAEASLAIARARAKADQVSWLSSDASQLPDVSVDAAVMTGNVAQVFLSDASWNDALASMHEAIRPGGHLVFEVRDPANRGWEPWTKAQSHGVIDTDHSGRVETWVELVEVALPLVTFRWTYRFERNGDELHSTSTLRFRSRIEIEQSLEVAGFRVSDVRDAPDRPNKEFVFIAQRLIARVEMTNRGA